MENIQESSETSRFEVVTHELCVEVRKAARKKRNSYHVLMKRGDGLLDALEKAHLANEVYPDPELSDYVETYAKGYLPYFDIATHIGNKTVGMTINEALNIVFEIQDEILFDHVPASLRE